MESLPVTHPKPYAFVIMPFADALKNVYDFAIKPACEEAGFYCDRLDEQDFTESMLDRIHNQIAKADLIVADFTTKNPNVYYEAGYAHALGKRIVHIIDQSEDIPFDFKHYPHLMYKPNDLKSLKDNLTKRIKAVSSSPLAKAKHPASDLIYIINAKTIDGASSEPIRLSGEWSWSSHAVCHAAYQLNFTIWIKDESPIAEQICDIIFISDDPGSIFNYKYSSSVRPDGKWHHYSQPVSVFSHRPKDLEFLIRRKPECVEGELLVMRIVVANQYCDYEIVLEPINAPRPEPNGRRLVFPTAEVKADFTELADGKRDERRAGGDDVS